MGKTLTGGELNLLNGKAGISAPHKSVPVIKLVNAHKPKSAWELERLIAEHVNGNCSCGIVSQGTVEDFGRNLYEAQKTHWDNYKYTLEECVQWEYNLFVIQTLKGSAMESICLKHLQNLLGYQFEIKVTNNYVDENLRVDLEVFKNSNLIAGIQVKPTSYHHTRQGIQTFNETANTQYGKPVIYLFYDYNTEKFVNLQGAVKKLQKM